MAVGTGNITLDDVIEEMETKAPSIEFPDPITLESAFDRSVASGFDSNNSSRSDGKESLKDFRGYKHPPETLQLSIHRDNPVHTNGGSRVQHDYWIQIEGDSNPVDSNVTYAFLVHGTASDFLFSKGLTVTQPMTFTIPKGSMVSNTIKEYTLTSYNFRTDLDSRPGKTQTYTTHINYVPTFNRIVNVPNIQAELIGSTSWSHTTTSKNVYLKQQYLSTEFTVNPFPPNSPPPEGFSSVTMNPQVRTLDWIELRMTYHLSNRTSMDFSEVSFEYARPGTKVRVVRNITSTYINYDQTFEFNMTNGSNSYSPSSKSSESIRLPKVLGGTFMIKTTVSMKDSFTDFLPLGRFNSTITDGYTYTIKVQISTSGSVTVTT